MNSDIDVVLLRTFVAVCEAKSMTAAARATNKTQGAVSQQVMRLEQLLGLKLLERGRNGVRLTSLGEAISTKARRLLSLNDEIVAEARSGQIRGKVRLGVPYDLVATVTAPVLRNFAAAFPDVEILVRCGSSLELLETLKSGEADLVLVEVGADASRADCLRVERLVWVGARNGQAYLKTPTPISLVAESCAFRAAIAEALERESITWRRVYEGGSIEATMGTVRADLAITAWLESTVPADLDILSETTLPALPPFAIELHHQKQANPAALSLARYLREGFRRPDANSIL